MPIAFNNRLIRAALALAVLSVLPACTTPLLALPPAANADAPRAVDTDADYVLKPGDTVKLTVYGEETVSGEYTLDQRGQLTIPLAGVIDAAGATKNEARDEIASKLKKGRYLSTPLVTLNLLTTRPIFILGEVKTPGAYPWQPELTAFDAAALAGGYTPRSAHLFLIDRVVPRQGGGGIRRHLNGFENTPVLPGDSITVRERIF